MQTKNKCVPHALRNYLLYLIKIGKLPNTIESRVLSLDISGICNRYGMSLDIDINPGCNDGGMYVEDVWKHCPGDLKKTINFEWKAYNYFYNERSKLYDIVKKQTNGCIVSCNGHAFVIIDNYNGKFITINSNNKYGYGTIKESSLKTEIEVVCFFDLQI
tara:strand:+ start:470 stop:949 length:480 start_codon:yes stop_codon:yes gene_type:complete